MTDFNGENLKRMIARSGGMFSGSDLGKLLGRTARDWVNREDFPEPVWRVGPVNLYCGRDVCCWLRFTERWTAAEIMEGTVKSYQWSYGRQA